MNRKLLIWQLAGFLFTSSAGVILHFLYDWSGQKVFFSLFSAVNESIWEHMKLIFFPMFFFALFQYPYTISEYSGFWCVKLAGIFTGVLLIPVLYYSYTGILGVSADWVNILIFFSSAAASYCLEVILFRKGLECWSPSVAFLLLCLLGLLFFLFTFVPPEIPLFEDPQDAEKVRQTEEVQEQEGSRGDRGRQETAG